mgnify:CR=1 FL=1
MEVLQQPSGFRLHILPHGYQKPTDPRKPLPPNNRPYRWINAGKIRNTGVEITLGATPLMNDNFRWKTQFNFATNKNKIVSLGGTPNFQYASGNVSMPYKMMVVEGGSLGDIYGNVFVRDANGKILLEPAIDKDGNPERKSRPASGYNRQSRQDRQLQSRLDTGLEQYRDIQRFLALLSD